MRKQQGLPTEPEDTENSACSCLIPPPIHLRQSRTGYGSETTKPDLITLITDHH